MSHHPSYSMAALCSIGGAIGFLKAKSKPSLFGGLAFGALYLLNGIKNQKDYAYEGTIITSLALAGINVKKALQFRKPVPILLGSTALATFAYYIRTL